MSIININTAYFMFGIKSMSYHGGMSLKLPHFRLYIGFIDFVVLLIVTGHLAIISVHTCVLRRRKSDKEIRRQLEI